MTDQEITGTLEGVSFLVGNKDTVAGMPKLAALEPFDDGILDLLNDVSRTLIADRGAKAYPDVVTFAFWIRKANTQKLKGRFHREDGNIRLGRGVAFHIAPSNVPVNFAYSLAAGLLTGNANIVRVPSKDFPQVGIIANAFVETMEGEKNRKLADYVCLVRYGREKAVNDLLSSIADTRIVWGGDATIAELRRSAIGPRVGEITFADRFSIAVLDSDTYVSFVDREKMKAAEDFYNDTYLTDQNACTSPRLVVWLGSRREEAKEEFWGRLHELAKRKYTFQSIQGVNKLTGACLAVVAHAETPGTRIEPHKDNLLVRVKVPQIMDALMDLRGNSGYFYEYDCDDVLELKELCDDSRCQTIAYIGDVELLKPLLVSGVKGIDRAVPVGKTMDFDLIWDGYDLYGRLTRVIALG